MLAGLVIAVIAVAAVVVERGPGRVRHRDVDLSAYVPMGMWVDVFDYVPAYNLPNRPVPVPVEAVDDMARRGVGTIFLQAARDDDRVRGLIDADLLSAWIERAHDRNLKVVGWYLPKLASVERDLDTLLAVERFTSTRGDTFDGLAVDIEETTVVPDVEVRNQRLIELSTRLRAAVGPDVALAGNVLPAVQLEVINPAFWPDFPWRALRDLYDVWLPMTYWTNRRESSGYRDGYRYTAESVERMRRALHDPQARVAPIGGLPNESTPIQIAGFLRALTDVDAIGGSIYDYRTMTPAAWLALAPALSPP